MQPPEQLPLHRTGAHRSWREVLGDLWGGLTVAALVIPLSIGLAVTAGLRPEQGLYASALPMLVFAVLASSRRTMIGPDASVTALIVTVVVPIAHERGADLASLVAALAIASGLLCVIAALVGAGRLASLFSEAALTGYLAGLALVVSITQIERVSRIDVEATGSVASITEAATHLSSMHLASAAVGVGTCVCVLLAKAWRPTIPWMPIGVTLATLIVAASGPGSLGVQLIGDLPTGLPELAIPRLSAATLIALAPAALAIAAVTFADTLATASAFAARHHESDDPGRDLAALGLADIASGFSGGMPVSASGARTAAATAAGGTSQWSAVFGAGFVLVALAGGGRWLSSLPLPALGGIVVAAVVPMIDAQAFRRMYAGDRLNLYSALVVVVTVVGIGVLQGIVAAIAVSIATRLIERRRTVNVR